MTKQIPYGVSGKSFYYMSAGEHAAFEIYADYTFKERLNREALKKAANQTIANFPEFAFRPAVHNGCIVALENHEEIPMLEDDGTRHYYGTDDTAGYIFRFLCRDDGFTFAYFHAISDAKGVNAFIHTVLWYYAQEIGLDAAPMADVRTSDEQALAMDELERYDPYRKYAKEPVGEPGQSGGAAGAFLIPEENYPPDMDINHEYQIRMPLKGYIKNTKSVGASAATFLVTCLSRAIDKLYHPEEPIHAMLSADMRRYYESHTMVNFSDALTLLYDFSLSDRPFSEQASLIKESMKSQLCKEHFDPLLISKIQMIDGFEKSGVPVTEWNKRFGAPLNKESTVITYALTYPGALDLSEDYDSLIQKIVGHVYVGGLCNLGVRATSFRDELVVRVNQMFDSSDLMEHFARELKEHGTPGDVRLEDLGTSRGSKLINEKLLSV